MTFFHHTLFSLRVVFLMLPSLFYAQSGIIKGKVTSEDEGEKLTYCTIYIDDFKYGTLTDEKGFYQIDPLPYGEYTVSFEFVGFKKLKKRVKLSGKELLLNVSLEQTPIEIESIVVIDDKREEGSMRRMRSIEGLMVSEGKKNEVIQMKGINANKAVNLGRQVYAAIPGLNIWESDGAGLQLGIGGRGLNPSRTSNFNTRQNGYDISADALGYPESYYTPPSEAIEEIQLIRGAASLQFGTQFGGLLNFVLQDGPEDERLELIYRNTMGSFDLKNSYLSAGFREDTWKGFGYFQKKSGREFRPNSNYDLYAGGINLKKHLSEKAIVGIEFTKQYYLAQQPGGLTDKEFEEGPTQSKRSRNWFEVDWNLFAGSVKYEFSPVTKIKTQFFGLIASRHALGILGNISRLDNSNEERNLISGEFKNWGNETRFLHIYEVGKNPWAILLGARYYQGYNLSLQGVADTTNRPNFVYTQQPDSRYEFPSRNVALFTENIFRLSSRFSITPGIRFEYINTTSEGSYQNKVFDLAGNLIFDTTLYENRNATRSFFIGGIGVDYKWNDALDIYANFSQNYRSINFTDMQIQNSNFRIDPNLKDETGFNGDIGVRGVISNKLNYDVSGFALLYDNRIGEIDSVDSQTFIPYRLRTNVSEALVTGIEALVELDWWKIVFADSSKTTLRTFANLSYTNAEYVNSDQSAFEGKKVESVPPFNLKTGVTFGYKFFSITYQYSYIQEHFSDATNAGKDINGEIIYIPGAVVGIIPSYSIMDLSMKLEWSKLSIETGVNNLNNEIYFTRRATGYPGPGIIPSPTRNYYFTLQLKI